MNRQELKLAARILENLPVMTLEIMQGWIDNPRGLQKFLLGLCPEDSILTTPTLVAITLAKQHNPDTFFKTRSGLYVWDDFRSRVVAKASPIDAGAKFRIERRDLIRDAKDSEVEGVLTNHLFEESAVCAVIAELISKQPNGKAGTLLNNGYANLFYTSSCVVCVGWRVYYRGWGVRAWRRGDRRWNAGSHVFSPATAA